MKKQTETKVFSHHLYDTIVLLDGTTQIANMVKNPKQISDTDIELLRRYNGGFIDSTKNKLANINTILENPEQTSTLFRSMPAPDSGTSQHPIPLEASTRFRNKPAGDSGASQQVFVIYRNDLLS